MAKTEKAVRPDYPVFSITDPADRIVYINGENFNRHSGLIADNAVPIVFYPPLGNVWIALEFAFRGLGIKTLTQLEREIDHTKPLSPPGINNQTKNLGAQNSPDGVCYPLKPLIGDILQSANRVELLREKVDYEIYPLAMTHESSGVCRERTYGRLTEARLHDYYRQKFGHTKFDFYIVRDSIRGVLEFIPFLLHTAGKDRGAQRLLKPVNFIGTIRLINEAIERLDMAEIFEKDVRYTQSLISEKDFHRAEVILQGARLALASSDLPLAKRRRAAKETSCELSVLPTGEDIPKGNIAAAGEIFLNNVLDEMRQKQGKIFVTDVLGEMHRRLDALPRARELPLGEVAIVGEIFLIEELASSAADIGAELGKRGFNYTKMVGHSYYTHKAKLDLQRLAVYLAKKANPFRKDTDHVRELAAAGGLERNVGGHGQKTVATFEEIIQKKAAGKKTYDGVVEVLPFNCLPQIVADNIIKARVKQANEVRVPYIWLLFDEMTAPAGVKTRIEAFLDMIVRKKRLVV